MRRCILYRLFHFTANTKYHSPCCAIYTKKGKFVAFTKRNYATGIRYMVCLLV